MFCERLKGLRQEAGLSQRELATALAVSQQTLAKWEGGKATPNPQTLLQIARLLHTTADYLAGGDQGSPHPEGGEISEADLKFALFRGDRDISDQAYREVQSFADFIRQKYKRQEGG